MKVYDDSNYKDVLDYATKNQFAMTCEPRDFAKVPRGSIAGAPAATIKIPPRSDWSAMIKERNEKGMLLSKLWLRNKTKVLSQGQTNYCWVNGVVSAMYAMRAANGLPFLELSPASVAAQIKGFRNVGGWGTEALEWIIRNGINRASLWPCNAIDRKYLTAESKADALTNRVTEWADIGPRNFDLQMAYALALKPLAVGYNWWRHEVCQLDPVEIEPGSFGILIVNSWDVTWDDDGMAVLREGKATADDAVCPEVMDAIAA